MTDGPGPCPAPFNLTDYVLSAGRAEPTKIALEMIGGSQSGIWTFERLESAILGTATGFLKRGLRPGDRLLLRLGNEVSFPIAFLAAIAVGIIPVPTSAALTEFEIAKVAKILRPKAVIRSPGISIPSDIDIIESGEMVDFRGEPPAKIEQGDPNRACYIILTSGTSGDPRLVVHAHRAIWARRMMWDGWYGLRSTDRLAHAGAFNWTYTLGTGLLDPWSVGATALIPVPDLERKDYLDVLATSKATIFAAAPGVFRQMLRDQNTRQFPNLRHGLSAGEKCADEVLTKWKEVTQTPLYEAYGQSEISTFISGSPTKPAPPGTIGYPQPGRKVSILDSDGQAAAVDQAGNIAIHKTDPGLMLGTLDEGDDTQVLDGESWFRTGDTGSQSADGAITFLGRQDDLLNAGGFRVSPLEVENAVAQHPGVSEVVAIDVEIKEGTTVIGAFYTGPGEISTELLREFVQPKLADYKCPRIFVHKSSLPKNANGKHLRRTLRAAYRWPHGQT